MTASPVLPVSAAPFDPTAKIFLWGPIQAVAGYTSTWYEAASVLCHQRYPYARWPDCHVLSRQGRFVFLLNDEPLRRMGRIAFEHYLLPDDAVRALREDCLLGEQGLLPLIERFETLDLRSFSDEGVADLWDELSQALVTFWLPTCVYELANYGSPVLLEERLLPLIPDATERAAATEALTAPEQPSFYQEEEVALAQTSDIEAHARIFGWLKNSYAGSQQLPVSFFEERKRALPSDVTERFTAHGQQVRDRLKDVIERQHLPEDVVRVARRMAEAISWQDQRKKQVLRTLAVQDRLLHEGARRRGTSFALLVHLLHKEVSALFHGGLLPENAFARYGTWSVAGCEDLHVVTGEEAEHIWKTCVEPPLSAAPSESGSDTRASLSVQGVVASRGKEGDFLRGTARVLLDPLHADQVQPGDILLAPMTSPEYIFAMKRAAAVVTDAGGITSHAAVVSRELGIPCIVGTGHATRIFRDGDLLLLDIQKGIVRYSEE